MVNVIKRKNLGMQELKHFPKNIESVFAKGKTVIAKNKKSDIWRYSDLEDFDVKILDLYYSAIHPRNIYVTFFNKGEGSEITHILDIRTGRKTGGFGNYCMTIYNYPKKVRKLAERVIDLGIVK